MNKRKNLIDPSKYKHKSPYTMTPKYVTFHNTDNSNAASADAEVRNLHRDSNTSQVSFHVAVDENEAVQAIPYNRNAWAAGDGDGPGNRESIHVEICKNKLGANSTIFKQCEANGVEVCAQLLKEHGLGIDRLKPHKYWSGKNCPSTTNHQDFINRVKIKLDELNNPKPTEIKYAVLINSYSDIVKARSVAHMLKEEDNLYSEVIPYEGKYAIKIYPLSPLSKAEGIQKLVKEKYDAYSDIIKL